MPRWVTVNAEGVAKAVEAAMLVAANDNYDNGVQEGILALVLVHRWAGKDDRGRYFCSRKQLQEAVAAQLEQLKALVLKK